MKKYLLLGLSLLGTAGQASTFVENAIPTFKTNESFGRHGGLFLVCPPSQVPTIPGAVRATLEKIEPSSDDAAQISERVENKKPIGLCVTDGMTPTLISRLYENIRISILKDAHLTINPIHCEIMKTISEDGRYLCTAYLNDGEIEHYHITITSGSLTIPQHWLIEDDLSPEEDPSLEESIAQ